VKILYVTNEMAYFRLHRENVATEMANRGHQVTVAAGSLHEADLTAFPRSISLVSLDLDKHSFRPILDLRLIRRLAYLIRSEKPDIVHAITIKPILFGSMAAILARGRGQRMVWTIPGLGKIFEPGQRVYHHVRRAIVRITLSLLRKNLVVETTCENDDDLGKLEDMGIVCRDRGHVIMGTGLPRQFHGNPVEPRKRHDGPLTILMATRLIHKKGVDVYLRAAKDLKGSGAVCIVQLAGIFDPANPDSVAPELIHNAHENGDVVYKGAVSAKEMPALLAKADVFCLPSRLREGFPRALLEAAACGCCLVGSDQNIFRTLIKDGETGLILHEPDETHLSNALNSLVGDVQRARAMGQAAQHLVNSLPVWDEDIIAVFNDIYEKLLEGS